MFKCNINIQEENKTKYIAEEISKLCKRGDIIGLSGKMGTGKTTFIRYFIKKISNTKRVTSPSYNLMLPYESNKSVIYHMDVWRIKNSSELISLGITEMFEKSIFLIEWAEKIKDILPNNFLKLCIENKNENRVLILEGNKTWNERLKKLINNEKN